MNYRILIIDDDMNDIKSTEILLSHAGYQVDFATTPAEAMNFVKNPKNEYALVLMDYQMPAENGAKLTLKVKTEKPEQIVAMYSNDDSREAIKESLITGVIDWIDKDCDPSEFIKKVAQFCEKYEVTSKSIRAENSQDHKQKAIEKAGFIGRSDALYRISQSVQIMAPENQTVLISGESGAGKELVAQALHKMSQRPSGPFIAINCSAIPKDLIESTLFGHEKGSFTSANNKQAGKFLLAHRGTLFLDEIGELPLELQGKILRALQEKEIDPVGANKPIKVDVRIVAATNRNLEQMVKDGTFREDLFYRLNVLNINVPPLRDRPQDIEPLVAYFTETYNRTTGKDKKFQQKTLDILVNYPWPGNIRELKGQVERHLVLAPGNLVRVEDLSAALFPTAKASAKCMTDYERDEHNRKRGFVIEALKKSRTKTEAATILGVSNSHLQYYLDKVFNLDFEEFRRRPI